MTPSETLTPTLQAHVDMQAVDLQQEFRLSVHELAAVTLAANARWQKLDEQTRANEPYVRILLSESMRRVARRMGNTHRGGKR